MVTQMRCTRGQGWRTPAKLCSGASRAHDSAAAPLGAGDFHRRGFGSCMGGARGTLAWPMPWIHLGTLTVRAADVWCGATPAAGEAPEFYRLSGVHDPVSALSHLLGAAAFVVLGCLLLRRGRGDAARLAFLGVYAVACVFLLLMSGMYHMTKPGSTLHQVMLRLDHGAIFVLIAGTFTPIHGLLFRGALRWGPLVLIWIAATAGVVVKTAFFDRLAEWLSLTFYITLGWVGAASGFVLWRRYGFAFIRPLLLGGVAYSIGAAVDFLRRPVLIPGVVQSHELFHVAVLIGALLHWRFIWKSVGGSAEVAYIRGHSLKDTGADCGVDTAGSRARRPRQPKPHD